MAQSKILGILGGLGPMASVYFYELVTQHTRAQKDQDHIDIVISSRASTPDRTAFILGQSDENPLPVMEEEARRLVQAGAEVLALPCNTAHYFYSSLAAATPIPLLDMVGDTVRRVRALGGQKLGILATTGTVSCRTYQKECEAQSLAWAVPDDAGQAAVMQVIYDDIKAGRKADMQKFYSAANQLFADGCDRIVLGCTELSLLKKTGELDEKYVDSMEVLAHAAILACGKTPTGFIGWDD